jgi:hypothetical protein
MQLAAMDSSEVNISGLDKITLLQRLFDRAKPRGRGFEHHNPNNTLSPEAAQMIIENGNGEIDYLFGRVMKVHVAGDTLNTRLFNRDNGAGVAEQVVQNLRAEQ